MGRERGTQWRLPGLLGLSTLVHLAAWAALGSVPAVPSRGNLRAETIEIAELEELSSEPRAPTQPEPQAASQPEPEPLAEPEPVRVRRARTTRPSAEPQVVPRSETAPSPPEPPPLEEAIADFSGITLTNDMGGSWQSAVGDGSPMEGPIGQPGAHVTGRRREGTGDGIAGASGPPGPPSGPRVVAFADLSRRPSPRGDLNALLQRHYPARARQLGIEGHVVLRFRILPDGSVTRVRVRSESPPDQGFAEACRRTIELAQWEPPLAVDGSAVATDVSFECEFVVGL